MKAQFLASSCAKATLMSDQKLDSTDLRILKELQVNSKVTNLELSKRVGLSPAPTLERVKKLESSDVILSYHAKVNPDVLGLHVKTFVLVSLNWKKTNSNDQFIQQIREIDEITECHIITGEGDFLLKIICKDLPAYEKLLFNSLSKIEEIERLRTFITLSTVKDKTLLPFDYEDTDNSMGNSQYS